MCQNSQQGSDFGSMKSCEGRNTGWGTLQDKVERGQTLVNGNDSERCGAVLKRKLQAIEIIKSLVYTDVGLSISD